MNEEQIRLKDEAWKNWGPYVSDRQWGTVREDYSADGDAWSYTTHDDARSKAFRWGEEGIAGICDKEQMLCFAIALWNKKDPIIKERYFGFSNPEGNHGEDVKELYYYLDNTPTHSYMKMLYKYPQQEFPYQWLIEENRRRTKADPEFELIDTGIFNEGKYFDVFVEYAKNTPEDILINITVNNRSNENAMINVLPTLWFRNTWSYQENEKKYLPELKANGSGIIKINHKDLGQIFFVCEDNPEMLFCNNNTNTKRLYNYDNGEKFYKDGINDYVIHQSATLNPEQRGTKASVNYNLSIDANKSISIRLRLSKDKSAFEDFNKIFDERKKEADTFYQSIQHNEKDKDAQMIMRQAFAGMLWNKQFYYYNLSRWLEGDTEQISPPEERKSGRNNGWKHINCKEIISMPDKWEYPWFAAWDLAFHCVPFAVIDTDFAKGQLLLLTKTWYMHPNGHLPAYEWDFSDANPPVHALATWIVYYVDKQNNNGKGDSKFLEKMFHKLIINFTWWVNRKDANGSNIFEGGFLGLDNIGVFDRNIKLPDGARLEQADATSWMAMYCLNLLRIALELSAFNDVYEEIAVKFFEHFLSIVGAMSGLGESGNNLWDEEDEFYYDRIFDSKNSPRLKTRSITGLIPLFVVEIFDGSEIINRSQFYERMKWFRENRPELAGLVSRWEEKNKDGKQLVSLLRKHRLEIIVKRMLDEKEFLSDYGIRSLSKYHLEHPFIFNENLAVQYTPGESTSEMFGGNSNWRGPIWMPINFLIIESLLRFHEFYGDDFSVECPTGSGNYLNLEEVADELGRRVASIFLKDKNGRRAVFGENELLQSDANFKDYVLFHEYFHGDNGKGLGASHQTGWTGLIVRYLMGV
jgi:hypothetical protein